MKEFLIYEKIETKNFYILPIQHDYDQKITRLV